SARERVATGSLAFEVMTPDVLLDCTTAPGLFTGKRYAAIGQIVERGAASEHVTRSLRAKAGTAARFDLECGGDGGQPFRVCIFSRSAEHARLLLQYARRPEKITVILYVLVKPIADGFPGFQSLGGAGGVWPFAFVVEQIIVG